MALEKPTTPVGDAPGTGRPSVVDTYFPLLIEYVTNTSWADGSSRLPSTLLLLCEAGQWKACLNDKALGRTGWATGATPEDVLASLERALAEGSMDWRKAKDAGGKRR